MVLKITMATLAAKEVQNKVHFESQDGRYVKRLRTTQLINTRFGGKLKKICSSTGARLDNIVHKRNWLEPETKSGTA